MKRRKLIDVCLVFLVAILGLYSTACGLLGSDGEPSEEETAFATSTPVEVEVVPSPSPTVTPPPATPTPTTTPAPLIIVNPASELSLTAVELPENWSIDEAMYQEDTFVVRITGTGGAREEIVEIRVMVLPGVQDAEREISRRLVGLPGTLTVEDPGIGRESLAYLDAGEFKVIFRDQNVFAEVTAYEASDGSLSSARTWARRLESRIERLRRIGVSLERDDSIPGPGLPTPTATPVVGSGTQIATPTATPILVPRAPGYLEGAEHGFALVQTTRAPSVSRPGWAEITLALAITKFQEAADATSIEVRSGPLEVCFVTAGPSDDCMSVIWGVSEQFQAELTPSREDSVIEWPSDKTWPFSLTFQVPDSATQASLLVPGTQVSIDLEGDQSPALEGRSSSQAPTPGPLEDGPAGADGYFLSGEYGIAVTSVSRQTDDILPTWVEVTLDLAVATFPDDPSSAPLIRTSTGLESTCFMASVSTECVRVLWGPQEQFDAVLALNGGDVEVEWPRRKDWPATLTYLVPESVENATLIFGGTRIPLDQFGMTGAAPAYDYRLHYPEISVGTVLYDVDDKIIALLDVDHDQDTGAIILTFYASNNTENLDFAPLISGWAARVSLGGQFVDGSDDAASGWDPVSVSGQGTTLAPGTFGGFQIELPRIAGLGFEFVELSDDLPDAVVLQLTAGDGDGDPNAMASEPVYVLFERSSTESRFWRPDLTVTAVDWDPTVPTIGDGITVTVTVENLAEFVSSSTSSLTFEVDGAFFDDAQLPAILPGEAHTEEFTWTATGSGETFGGWIDPSDQIEERDETNNRKTVGFGGAFLSDLVMDDLSWSPQQPSVGDTVTFTLTVKNQGQGSAGSFSAKIKFDEESPPQWILSYSSIGSPTEPYTDFHLDRGGGLAHFSRYRR